MSNAFSGLGTKFLRWDSSNPTSSGDWEVIAEVISISGPTMTREFIDVTSLDSIGGYREFIAGFRDGCLLYTSICADLKMLILCNY